MMLRPAAWSVPAWLFDHRCVLHGKVLILAAFSHRIHSELEATGDWPRSLFEVSESCCCLGDCRREERDDQASLGAVLRGSVAMAGDPRAATGVLWRGGGREALQPRCYKELLSPHEK